MKYEKQLKLGIKLSKVYKKKYDADLLQGKNNYSLFNSVLNINDEVNLHSKFIYSMINPKGKHLQKSLFLKLFLKSIDLELADKINYANVKVTREKDQIDLLIEDGQTYIIIENKLNAKDQDKQIYRYIQTVYEKYGDNSYSIDIVVIYLSKNNRAIDPQSLGPYSISIDQKYLVSGDKKIRYFHINYNNQIPIWVAKSSQEIRNISNLSHAFEEYQLILHRINRTMSNNEAISFSNFILHQIDEQETQDYLELSAHIMQNFYNIWIEKIIAAINSIEGLQPAIITDISDLPTNTNDKNIRNPVIKSLDKRNLIKWFQKSGDKKGYKDIGICFYGRDKNGQITKNVILFAVDFLYIATYQEDFLDFNQDKVRNSILNKDPREIIVDPDIVNDFIPLIQKRITELLNLNSHSGN